MKDEATTRPALLALAAWTELEATAGMLLAATMRDDAHQVEALRAKAHDILDHHLDLKIETIAAIRERVRKQIDRI